MRESRSASLLDFAIAASLAVVPLLLGVFLALHSLAPPSTPDADQSHLSVRQLAALRTFERAVVRRDAVSVPLPDADALVRYVPGCADEWDGRDRPLARLQSMLGRTTNDAPRPARALAAHVAEIDAALLRFSSGGNRRVVEAVGFDAARWAEAARTALAKPVDTPRYPGKTFQVRCSDLASALATLARGDGRMLGSLAWRGTEVERVTARWRRDQYVEISDHHLARPNPWGSVPGCVYLWAADAVASAESPAFFVRMSRSTNERVCRDPSVFAIGVDNGASGVAPVAIAPDRFGTRPGDDASWAVPPSLHALIQPLEALRRPSGALYRTYVADADPGDAPRRPNRVALYGGDVEVGFSVDLTIDPALQSLAQKVAACYTGRQDVCRALGVRRAEDGADAIGHLLLESAVVRMAAIAIVDVASGRIEALAGALSPCARQEVDGPGRDAGCDGRLPYPIRYRPDALMNPAVFHDAMPASVIKPVMAAAFLSNAAIGSRWLAAERTAMRARAEPGADTLRGQLMRSNSARFLDRMFCGDQGFRPCERIWEVEATAHVFGWNTGCAAGSVQCGRRDLLFGRSTDAAVSSSSTTADSPASNAADPRSSTAAMPVDAGAEAPAEWIPYGRLMVEPALGKSALAFHTRPAIALDHERVKRCAAGADGRRGTSDDWEKCKGGVVVDVVAEGWGQGHARATALGAAGMMAALAASANGETTVHRPHLVRAVRSVGPDGNASLDAAAARWSAAAAEPTRISRDAAEVILSGLSYSHRLGTARLACEQVLDPRTCREIDWIAGKTGTPTFPNDDRSLDDLAALCATRGAEPASRRAPVRTDDGDSARQAACGGLRPYKWYVAAYRSSPGDARWTKAIGVLTERNWLAATGRIHGAGDRGPNPAAEIAFQIAKRHVGARGAEAR